MTVLTDEPIEVLLIEDNPDDVRLALHAFKQHNLKNEIHVARDGAEALDFLFCTGLHVGKINKKPRLILLDLKLPKVDGLEVLKRIKGDMLLRSIPVVIMTSSREERDVVESYQLGVNSYIVKPVDFDKFMDAVKQLGLYWLLLNQPPILQQ